MQEREEECPLLVPFSSALFASCLGEIKSVPYSSREAGGWSGEILGCGVGGMGGLAVAVTV